jgi:hypothetical protein
MIKKIISRNCPNCASNLSFKLRLGLIKKSLLQCPNCHSHLTPDILTTSVSAMVVGAPAWYLVDIYAQSFFGVSEPYAIFFGFVTCMSIVRICYPLANLVIVSVD